MDGALLVTFLLSLGSLVFIVSPVRRSAARPRREEERILLAEKSAAMQLLGDLELDRQTGKLTDEDYRESRAEAERGAIAAMKQLDALSGQAQVDPLEELIRLERVRLQKEAAQ